MNILWEEMKGVRAVHEKRKERQSGKHLILKNRSVLSSEEVAKVLLEAEKATEAKKKAATKNHRNRKKKAISSDEDISSSIHDSSDSSERSRY